MTLAGARCIAFDIDDTLYLERAYVHSGFVAVERYLVESLGCSAGFAELAWAEFLAGRRNDTFDCVLPQLDVVPTKDILATLVGVYRRHLPTIALLPDARILLTQLNGTVALAVISDGPLESQVAKVEALRLREFVRADAVLLTAEFGPAFGKPHPRAFEAAQNASGASGPDCVYVADNPIKDFKAPKALGWRTVRVRRPDGLHAHIESGPDVDIEVVSLENLVL